MDLSKYSTDTLNEMYCHLYFKKFNRLPKSSSSCTYSPACSVPQGAMCLQYSVIWRGCGILKRQNNFLKYFSIYRNI